MLVHHCRHWLIKSQQGWCGLDSSAMIGMCRFGLSAYYEVFACGLLSVGVTSTWSLSLVHTCLETNNTRLQNHLFVYCTYRLHTSLGTSPGGNKQGQSVYHRCDKYLKSPFLSRRSQHPRPQKLVAAIFGVLAGRYGWRKAHRRCRQPHHVLAAPCGGRARRPHSLRYA